jgi:uncharacterized Zn-binding protein involved in type VI secretion
VIVEEDMAPAARATDPTSHGGPLSPGLGSHNVSIGGKPAWRATFDVSTCSQSDGNKPHVGGVVAKGSSKVFINQLPAAREGDNVVEVGPTNSIRQGFAKVDIGD